MLYLELTSMSDETLGEAVAAHCRSLGTVKSVKVSHEAGQQQDSFVLIEMATREEMLNLARRYNGVIMDGIVLIQLGHAERPAP